MSTALEILSPLPSLVPAQPSALAVPDRGVVALDGEGYTTKTGEHLYCYMAASRADGLVDECENPEGLSTREIFDFLFRLPEGIKVGFALGYDFTKWFEDLHDGLLYRLYRPETHLNLKTGRPEGLVVLDRRGHPLYDERCEMNLVSTKLTLRRGRRTETSPGISGDHAETRQGWTETVTVWDFFRFFGRAFVATLEDWNVATAEEREEIQRMKDRRGDFEGITDEEKRYCQSEVRHMAVLANKLLAASAKAGIRLTSYYGPGSLAAAMLDKDDARAARPQLPDAMLDAVQRAFFGGRFEISQCGPVLPCWGDDLASAYPYAETAIPCFRCGTKDNWRLVTGSHEEVLAAVRAAARGGSVALCHYALPVHPSLDLVPLEDEDDFQGMGELPPIAEPTVCTNKGWGPFPFRLKDGSIVFPVCSRGGWIWSVEVLPALDHPHLWPNIELRGAWVYDKPCDCPPPFLETVANGYKSRLEWGKEGPGLVIKLGLNSRYGKRAQSIGQAPYRCLTTAGLITACCRGQILDGIGRAAKASSEWDVVSVATDGILLSRPVELPEPRDTGTKEVAAKYKKLPLGAWEPKDFPNGVHSIRPGMRFRLDVGVDEDAKEEGKKIKDTAARGLGVKVLHEYRAAVLRLWKERPGEAMELQQKPVFHGAKGCITLREEKRRRGRFLHGKILVLRHPDYGKWVEPDPYQVSYAPLPKRPRFGPGHRLLTWALLPGEGESHAYDRKKKDRLLANQELQAQTDLAECQPEGTGPQVAGEGDD